jgi:hypothetical protein
MQADPDILAWADEYEEWLDTHFTPDDEVRCDWCDQVSQDGFLMCKCGDGSDE